MMVVITYAPSRFVPFSSMSPLHPNAYPEEATPWCRWARVILVLIQVSTNNDMSIILENRRRAYFSYFDNSLLMEEWIVANDGVVLLDWISINPYRHKYIKKVMKVSLLFGLFVVWQERFQKGRFVHLENAPDTHLDGDHGYVISCWTYVTVTAHLSRLFWGYRLKIQQGEQEEKAGGRTDAPLRSVWIIGPVSFPSRGRWDEQWLASYTFSSHWFVLLNTDLRSLCYWQDIILRKWSMIPSC